jgi:hypothetical protein
MLSTYQKFILRTTLDKERTEYVTCYTLSTGAGYFSAYDAYRKLSYVETAIVLTGSVLFSPASMKNTSEGGYYQTSDVTIVFSRDNKALVQAKDTKLMFNSVKFRVNRLIDCTDSNEIVVFASRLE